MVALGIASPAVAPSASPNAVSSAAATTDASTEATPAPPTIVCRRDPGDLPPYLADDPCPLAIVAVDLAVAPIRLPIDRIAIEPGPLFCSIIWEGLPSPPNCYGPIFQPGQFMHAYVRFRGTDKVGVVMLGLDLRVFDNAPTATRAPWSFTLVTFEIPPAGWVMP